MNAFLAKTVSEGQRDWDDQLPFVLAAYRATMHHSTGFTPNRLVLGKEVLAPIDVVYGSVDDEDRWEDYGAFVEDMRDRAVNAFAQVRRTLGRAEKKK